MRYIYLVILTVFMVNPGYADINTIDNYNILMNNNVFRDNYFPHGNYPHFIDVLKPQNFDDVVIVYTAYLLNYTTSLSVVFYKDMVLYSDDEHIIDKIENLIAPTKWVK